MSKRSALNAPVAVTDAKKAKVDSEARALQEAGKKKAEEARALQEAGKKKVEEAQAFEEEINKLKFEIELRKIFCAGAIVSRQDKEDPEESHFAKILQDSPNIILLIWHETMKEEEWKKHFDTYEEKFKGEAGRLIEDDSRFHWDYLDSTAIVVSLSGNKRKQTKDVPKQCSYKVDLCVSSDELAVEFHIEVLSMNKESDFITNAAKREGPIEWSESVVQWKERTGFDVRFEPFAYSSRQYDSIFLFFTIEWETMKIPATPTHMRKEIVKILPKVFDDVLILAKPEFSVRWKEEILNYLLKAQLKRLTLSRESETELTQLCEGLVTVPIVEVTEQEQIRSLTFELESTKRDLKSASSAAVTLQKELHNKRSHISEIELELANMKGQLIQAKEKIAELSRSAAKVDSDEEGNTPAGASSPKKAKQAACPFDYEKHSYLHQFTGEPVTERQEAQWRVGFQLFRQIRKNRQNELEICKDFIKLYRDWELLEGGGKGRPLKIGPYWEKGFGPRGGVILLGWDKKHFELEFDRMKTAMEEERQWQRQQIDAIYSHCAPTPRKRFERFDKFRNPDLGKALWSYASQFKSDPIGASKALRKE